MLALNTTRLARPNGPSCSGGPKTGSTLGRTERRLLTVKFAVALFPLLVVLILIVRLLESRFAFFPTLGETVTPREFGVNYTPLSIATRDGERLRGWALIQ